MQFKIISGFVWNSGLMERFILVLATKSAILKAFHTPNDSLIYLNKSILPFISVMFCSSSDFEFLVLKGISKCLQISLSILHLKEESLFSLAISQRLNTSYISGCLTPIASTTGILKSVI